MFHKNAFPDTGSWIQTSCSYKSKTHQNRLPNRVNFGDCFNPLTKKAYIIGGYYEFNELTNDSRLGTLDVNEFDCETQITKILKLSRSVTLKDKTENAETFPFGNDTPVMRYGLKTCFLATEKYKNDIFIYGGMGQASNQNCPSHRQNLSSVYSYNLKTNRYSRIDCGETLFNPDMTEQMNSPGIRAGHAMVPLPKTTQPGFLVFGGFLVQEYSTLNNDLWVFFCTEESTMTHKKGKWLEINPGKFVPKSVIDWEEADSFKPLPRDFCEMSVLGDDLVLYGGRCNDSYRIYYDPDVWVIRGLFENIFSNTEIEQFVNRADTLRWERIKSAQNVPRNFFISSVPAARRSHIQFVRNSKVYILGGADKRQFHFRDMWGFDLATEKWNHVSGKLNSCKSNEFLGRRRGSVAYLPEFDCLFTLCGTRPAVESDDQTSVTNSDKLYDLDSFDVFQFGDDLRSLCLEELVSSCNECESLTEFTELSESIQNRLEKSLESGFRDHFSMIIGYEVKTANYMFSGMEKKA